jgi:hypothetical protein
MVLPCNCAAVRAALQQCRPATVLPCCPILLSFICGADSAALRLCRFATVRLQGRSAMQLCCHSAALLQRYPATQLCCHIAVLAQTRVLIAVPAACQAASLVRSSMLASRIHITAVEAIAECARRWHPGGWRPHKPAPGQLHRNHRHMHCKPRAISGPANTVTGLHDAAARLRHSAPLRRVPLPAGAPLPNPVVAASAPRSLLCTRGLCAEFPHPVVVAFAAPLRSCSCRLCAAFPSLQVRQNPPHVGPALLRAAALPRGAHACNACMQHTLQAAPRARACAMSCVAVAGA